MKEGGNNWKGDKTKEKNTASSNIKDRKTAMKPNKGNPGEERMGMNAYSTQELWTVGIGLYRLCQCLEKYLYKKYVKDLYKKLINEHASTLLVIYGLCNTFIRNLNS